MLQQVSHLAGKYAAVPQGPPGNVRRRGLRVGLFFKGGNEAGLLRSRGEDIAVLFAGVGGLDAHEHQVGFPKPGLIPQFLQRLKIPVLHIGVHRADNHCLLLPHPLHIMQVCRRQNNGGEGIPAAGLHTDSHILAQLVMDGGNL